MCLGAYSTAHAEVAAEGRWISRARSTGAPREEAAEEAEAAMLSVANKLVCGEGMSDEGCEVEALDE